MVDRVLAGLARLRSRDAGPLSQGLTPEHAQACLRSAVDAISAAGLAAELMSQGQRPQTATIVAAAGVFTSPIEWVALLAAAGCEVRIKAPSSAPDLCAALAEELHREGLPVTADTQRDLGTPAAVVAFGSDAAMSAIQAATPDAVHALYGHRFSIALVCGDSVQAARGIAEDAARFDGRGCMAPTAVFTTGDPTVLAECLAEMFQEIETRWPRGEVDPALGPEWRRRTGLARILGHCHEGPAWAVPVLEPEHFSPVALPRMLPVHGLQELAALDGILRPWRSHLSTCGTDTPSAVPLGTLRTCVLGQMQIPAFPRLHDGKPMLGSILG